MGYYLKCGKSWITIFILFQFICGSAIEWFWIRKTQFHKFVYPYFSDVNEKVTKMLIKWVKSDSISTSELILSSFCRFPFVSALFSLILWPFAMTAIVLTRENMGIAGISTNSERVDLHGRNISHIEPNAFIGFPCMTHLYLGSNLIEEVDETMLNSYTKLVYIDLSYNRLKQIHPKSFANLTKLRTLKLFGSEEIIQRDFLLNLQSYKQVEVDLNFTIYDKFHPAASDATNFQVNWYQLFFIAACVIAVLFVLLICCVGCILEGFLSTICCCLIEE